MKFHLAHKFMSFRRLAVAALLLLLVLSINEETGFAGEARKVRIGYFEGGKYPYHDRLKDEFYRQLNSILPDSIEAVFAPEGYRSAEWDKAKSAQMAKELAGVESIELVVAAGPWVIKDLLDAGFKKPIIGVHQFAPQYEGFLDKKGEPIAENLTIHYQKNKIETDLTRLAGMVRLKRLGLLYFPSSNETDSVLAEAKAIGGKLGFEVITAAGENNKGTFAFFNAYGQLDKNIDALYVGPMWGCDIPMINQFFYNTNHNKIPVMTSEDRFLVDRGAFLTNNANGIFSEARFSAYKAAQIIMGKKPVSLPVEFAVQSTLAINEAAAKKNRITIDPKLYREAYVVPAPPADDATIVTLSFAIPRAFSFNPDDLSQLNSINSAVAEAIKVQDSLFPKEIDENTNLPKEMYSANTIVSIKSSLETKESQNRNSQSPQSILEQAVTKAFLNYLLAEEILFNELKIRELIDRNIEVSYVRQTIENDKKADLKGWNARRDKATQSIIDAQNNLKVAQVLLNVLMSNALDEKLNLEGDRFNAAATEKLFGKLFPYVSDEMTADSIVNIMGQISEKNESEMDAELKKIHSGFESLMNVSMKLKHKQISLEESVGNFDGGRLNIAQMAAEIDSIRAVQLEEIAARFKLYESFADVSSQLGWSAYESGGSFVARVEKLIIERK